MAKKFGPSRTSQGVEGGVSIRDANISYARGGDEGTESQQVNDYLANRRSAEYVGNGLVKMKLTRNQRRLAKKLGLAIEQIDKQPA